jgi:glutaminyl-tRNA synthetase
MHLQQSESSFEYGTIESCVREVLEENTPRIFAVIDPLKLTISNYPEDTLEHICVPCFPQSADHGISSCRNLTFGKDLYIDRSDFRHTEDKSFYGLIPGGKVRYIFLFFDENIEFITY